MTEWEEWEEYQKKHFRCDEDGMVVHIRQENVFAGAGLDESISFNNLEDIWDYQQEKINKLVFLLRATQYELRYTNNYLGKKYAIPQLIDSVEELFKQLGEKTHG